MKKEQRLPKLMGKTENLVRHIYNCGFNDGYDAARENILVEEKKQRKELVSEILAKLETAFEDDEFLEKLSEVKSEVGDIKENSDGY